MGGDKTKRDTIMRLVSGVSERLENIEMEIKGMLTRLEKTTGTLIAVRGLYKELTDMIKE